MRFLLDTDSCIAFLRGNGAMLSRLKAESPEDCRISAVSAFELFSGAEKSRSPSVEHAKINRLLEAVEVLPFERNVAFLAGNIRALLEKAGTPIGPYDVLIAAHARLHDLILVTGNAREFCRVDGLRIETWAR